MLSRLRHLQVETEGRYATDEELKFILDYVHSFRLRRDTYIRLQAAESDIVKEVQERLQAKHPELLRSGTNDLTTKWQRDTQRVLKLTALALLLDDATTLREVFLYWFQTIMKAFKAQTSCDVTYLTMQEVIKKRFTITEASLICPLLELNRTLLGCP